MDYSKIKGMMLDEVKQVFKPELLNRIDEIVVFRPLTRGDVVSILDLEVAKVRARLKDRGVAITLTPQAADFLVTKGFDQQYGARPLRRAVQRFVEDPLAEEILKGRFAHGESVEVDAAGETLVFNSLAAATV